MQINALPSDLQMQQLKAAETSDKDQCLAYGRTTSHGPQHKLLRTHPASIAAITASSSVHEMALESASFCFTASLARSMCIQGSYSYWGQGSLEFLLQQTTSQLKCGSSKRVEMALRPANLPQNRDANWSDLTAPSGTQPLGCRTSHGRCCQTLRRETFWPRALYELPWPRCEITESFLPAESSPLSHVCWQSQPKSHSECTRNTPYCKRVSSQLLVAPPWTGCTSPAATDGCCYFEAYTA